MKKQTFMLWISIFALGLTFITTNSKFVGPFFSTEDKAKVAMYEIDIEPSIPGLIDRNENSSNYWNILTNDPGQNYKEFTLTIKYQAETQLKFYVDHADASENAEDSNTTHFVVTDEEGNKQEDMPNGYWLLDTDDYKKVFTVRLWQVEEKFDSYITLIPRVEQVGGN